MQAILDFFTSFSEVISSVIDFVVGLVKDIVYLIQLTTTFVLEIPTYFSWLPGEFLATVVLIFTVVVLYKILGREG